MNIPKYLIAYRKDLELKAYAYNSIENYCSQVKAFLHHFDNKFTEPSKINEAAIKEWLLQAKSINGRKHRISAVKLFYHYTIRQPLKFKYIEYPRSEKKLPIVLSQDEIKRIINACDNLKHKAIIYLLYSTGMRVGEVINLKPEHIDSSRMIINIIAGKGMKDRQVMLDESVLKLLREYYRKYKPKEYLFNGQFSNQYTASSINQFLKMYAAKAGISKRIHAHLLRHCSFTHLVEQGTDINLIRVLAGHNNVRTTSIYTHLSHNLISNIPSPIRFTTSAQ